MAAVGVFMKFLRMVLDRVLQFPDHFWNGSPWCHTAMDTTLLTLPSTKFLKICIERFRSCLDAPRKIIQMESLHIRSIKYRLITKIITEFVCKLRDGFIKTN